MRNGFIYSYSQWNLQPLGFHRSIYSSSYLKRRFELLAISEHQNIIRLNYPRTTIKETNNWLLIVFPGGFLFRFSLLVNNFPDRLTVRGWLT